MASLLEQAQSCAKVMFDAGPNMREADRWLQQMILTQEAWGIANEFVNSPSTLGADTALQRVWFGAVIFANKLRNNFDQLPAASLPGLKATLQANIQRLQGVGAFRAAQLKLCVALVDLLLQEQALAPSARSIIQDLVQTFPPATSAALLTQLLQALPEQAASLPALSVGDRRVRLVEDLRDCGEGVLTLLHSLFAQAHASGSVDAATAVFRAMGTWFEFPGLPAAVTAASPAVALAVDAALGSPALLVPACQALRELMDAHYRTARRDPHANALAARLTEGLMRLVPLWEQYKGCGVGGEGSSGSGSSSSSSGSSAASGSSAGSGSAAGLDEEQLEECAKALSSLFATAVHTFLPERLRGAPVAAAGAGTPEGAALAASWEAEVRAWVQLLRLPAAHASRAVVEPTFRAWRKVAETYGEVEMEGRDASARGYSAGGGARLALVSRALGAPLLGAVPAWIAQLTFPPACEWNGEWNSEDRESFKHEFRYDCSDALLLIASVAGGSAVLDVMAERLQSGLAAWSASLAAAGGGGATGGSSDGWQGVEAVLYSLRAIARHVPVGEGKVLPQLFQLLLGGSLPLHAAHPELSATVFRIVGRYCEWLSSSARGGSAGELNPYQRAAWAFLLREGMGLRGGEGIDAASGARHEPHLPVALPSSPSAESACNALGRFTAYSGSYALDASVLSLPERLHLPALGQANADMVLSSWAAAALRAGRGGRGGGAPAALVAAALLPLCARLEALCGVSSSSSSGGSSSGSGGSASSEGAVAGSGGSSGASGAFAALALQVSGGRGLAAGALALCACDGTLAATLCSDSGEPTQSSLRAMALGSEAAHARLCAGARAAGGNIGPAALVGLAPGAPGSSACSREPSAAHLDAALRAACASPRAAFACVRSLLVKLTLALRALSAPCAQGVGGGRGGGGGGGGGEALVGGAGDWSAFAPPGFLSAWGAADKAARGAGALAETHARCQADYASAVRECVAALFAAAWPALEAALATYGAAAPASGPLEVDMCMEVVERVAEIVILGLPEAGCSALAGYASRFVSYLGAALGAPGVGAHPVVLRSVKRLVLYVSRAARFEGGSAALAALAGAVQGVSTAAIRGGVARSRGHAAAMLAPRANAGEKVLEGAEALAECLYLASCVLETFPGCLLEEAPGLDLGGSSGSGSGSGSGGGSSASASAAPPAPTSYASALLHMASAALASANPMLVNAAPTLLGALYGAMQPHMGGARDPAVHAARSALVHAALGENFAELVRRIVLCCTLEHLREFLNGQAPNLTGALYTCLQLGAGGPFMGALQAAVTPPGALFSPVVASRLPVEALRALLERMAAVAARAGGGGSGGGGAGGGGASPSPYNPPRAFEAAVHALYVAAVRGDARLLTHPRPEDEREEDEREDDWGFAFEDQEEYYYSDRAGGGSGGADDY